MLKLIPALRDATPASGRGVPMPENATAPGATLQPHVNELELLRSIVEGTASSTGGDFLRNLVRHLAEAVGMQHSFVSDFQGGELLRTLAFWSNGKLAANFEFELRGTPCEEVIG